MKGQVTTNPEKREKDDVVTRKAENRTGDCGQVPGAQTAKGRCERGVCRRLEAPFPLTHWTDALEESPLCFNWALPRKLGENMPTKKTYQE